MWKFILLINSPHRKNGNKENIRNKENAKLFIFKLYLPCGSIQTLHSSFQFLRMISFYCMIKVNLEHITTKSIAKEINFCFSWEDGPLDE
jgi:hypothetical protein